MPRIGEHHRFNHSVPRFMLRYWEQQCRGKFGVHVYHVADNRISFDSSRGRKPFKFAIVEDLYVPVIEGRRATVLEAGWMNSLETALARIIALAHRREALETVDEDLVTRFGMGLFALEQRFRHSLDLGRRAIEATPYLKGFISGSPERDAHRLMLENLIHITTELYNRHSPLVP